MDKKIINKNKYNKEKNDLELLEQLFNNLRNILRNEESITGQKALMDFSIMMFIRLLKPLIKNKSLSFEVNDFTKKINMDDVKYCNWDNLILIKQENESLFSLKLTNIINNILPCHNKLGIIFKGLRFNTKKINTIIMMFDEINKINIDDIDVDIKGKAYEMTLENEKNISSDFGQFFTPRWLIEFMIENINPQINEDGTINIFVEPAAGTVEKKA